MDIIVPNLGLQHLALHILSYLDVVPDLNNCRLVCKSWQELIDKSLFYWFYWLERLKEPTTEKSITIETWHDFRLAYAQVLECKDVNIISKFTKYLEEFLKEEDVFRDYSPIHWFAREGKTEKVLFLSKLMPHINGQDTWGDTVLIHACQSRHLELAQSLLDESKVERRLIDLNLGCPYGITPFMYACREDCLEIVKLFVEKSDERSIQLDARCQANKNAFYWAMMSDSPKLLDYLIEQFNLRNIELYPARTNGKSSFFRACYLSQSTNVIQYFLQNHRELGINLYERDDNGRSGFLMSCFNVRVDVVKLFIEASLKKGIFLDHIDFDANNCILNACYGHGSYWTPCRISTVKCLLENQSIIEFDVNETDDQGRTALMLAVLNGSAEVVQDFIDHAKDIGLNFNIRDNNGQNVLLMPTLEQYVPRYNPNDLHAYQCGALSLLLENVRRFGIEVNTTIPDEGGKWSTTFHKYCQCPGPKPLKILMSYCNDFTIDTNALDSNGHTGFMEACRLGLHYNVDCLIRHSLEAGIDLNVMTDSWMTGFMLACKGGHGLVVEVIENYSEMYCIDLKANNKEGKTGYDLWPKTLPYIGEPLYSKKRRLLCRQFNNL